MEIESVKKGTLVLKDKKLLELDGVKNVLGFDSSYVYLDTELGKLTIEGDELKIESLTKENGEIVIIGKIDLIQYSEEKSAKGLFKGIFK